MIPTALALSLFELTPLALAFSGGLDSRYLAFAASRLAGKGVALHLIHVTGPHVPAKESSDAHNWAAAHGLPLSSVPFDPLGLPEVRQNTPTRCYHCKRAMFEAIRQELDRQPALREATLCDGSNASDLSAYRPGLKALQELGVRSPLAEAGLDKSAIRRIAAATGLDRPDQKARPCLLTRFAYALPPTHEALNKLDAAEKDLETSFAKACEQKLLPRMPDFRLRLTAPLPADPNSQSGQPVLPFRTELHLDLEPPAACAIEIGAITTRHGFAPPSILLTEQVSGHYDRTTL